MQSFFSTMFVKVESCKKFVAMKILFYFFIILMVSVVSELRRQNSVISIIEKCIPKENNMKINFVFENVTSDETFDLLFTYFQGNQDRFFSNKW
jgi:hypothetical protein